MSYLHLCVPFHHERTICGGCGVFTPHQSIVPKGKPKCVRCDVWCVVAAGVAACAIMAEGAHLKAATPAATTHHTSHLTHTLWVFLWGQWIGVV
ncbi:hypothetical protein DPMN_085085 [Dreissena polymorpha]|uniref:Uncharacterized protein n=1 Tax=Dreissena polymorpha TaxID=45954 RepID=A0A9D4BJW9_DREPO|nr:hypothetical protein DPMN_085085 [Dreissena polymorpha]